MADKLITERKAKKLIGCTEEDISHWIQEGKLWAINIAINGDPEKCRACYRISKASALEMHQKCKKDAGIRKRRK